MFKDRKTINLLSNYYYKLPDFILNSRAFHKILYRVFIGRWFDVDFDEEYKKYSPKEWIGLYDNLFLNRIRDSDLSKAQKKYVVDHVVGNSVLEVGCGTGEIIQEILKEKKEKKIVKIVGNDISQAAIQFLTKKFKGFANTAFIEGDFLNLGLKEKFDTVLCLHVLEHIVDIDKMVRLLIESSKKRIILVVPREKYRRYRPNYHIHFFNEDNPITKYFMGRKNDLTIIDGDYILISDMPETTG